MTPFRVKVVSKADDWSLKGKIIYAPSIVGRDITTRKETWVVYDILEIEILREKIMEDFDSWLKSEYEICKTGSNLGRHNHFIEVLEIMKMKVNKRFGYEKEK